MLSVISGTMVTDAARKKYLEISKYVLFGASIYDLDLNACLRHLQTFYKQILLVPI